MPKEIFSEEEFLNIAKSATECRIKKTGDIVKLKLRTPKHLYTYKTDTTKAESLISQIEIEKIEL